MSALNRIFFNCIAATMITGYCGLVGSVALAASSPFAETVILNGKVITMDADEIDAISFAEAVAIRGNEIIAVGSNEEVRALYRKVSPTPEIVNVKSIEAAMELCESE